MVLHGRGLKSRAGKVADGRRLGLEEDAGEGETRAEEATRRGAARAWLVERASTVPGGDG